MANKPEIETRVKAKLETLNYALKDCRDLVKRIDRLDQAIEHEQKELAKKKNDLLQIITALGFWKLQIIAASHAPRPAPRAPRPTC